MHVFSFIKEQATSNFFRGCRVIPLYIVRHFENLSLKVTVLGGKDLLVWDV